MKMMFASSHSTPRVSSTTSIVGPIIISMIIITTMVFTSTMITISRVRIQPTPCTPRRQSLRT